MKIWLYGLLVLTFINPGYTLSGEDVLKKVEQTLTKPKDMESLNKLEMANLDGTAKESREMKIYVAGADLRVIKFTKPAHVNGIGLLVSGQNQMWIYLPELKRIRMIQGSFKNDSFQGTDFSYNEIGSYQYRQDYEADLVSENDENYVLDLKRKPDSEKTYDRIVMTVEKKTSIPVKMELYVKKELIKLFQIEEMNTINQYNVPVRVKVTDIKKQHYTKLVLQDVKFDQGLTEKQIFTQKFLKKKE